MRIILKSFVSMRKIYTKKLFSLRIYHTFQGGLKEQLRTMDSQKMLIFQRLVQVGESAINR